MSIRLLIADNQEIARAGLKCFLSGTQIEVVAEACSGTQTCELLETVSPDVVLLTVDWPSEDGVAVLRQIRLKFPTLPVIILANQDNAAHHARAHAEGAAGLVVKAIDRVGLVEAIQSVVNGELLWNRTQLRRVIGATTVPNVIADAEAPLTPRELEVLAGMTEGLTNRRIAERLGISYETVKEHVQHILRKVGVDDRTQAAVWAVRQSLV